MALPAEFQSELDAITAAHAAATTKIADLQTQLDAANATITEMTAAVKTEAMTVAA